MQNLRNPIKISFVRYDPILQQIKATNSNNKSPTTNTKLQQQNTLVNSAPTQP